MLCPRVLGFEVKARFAVSRNPDEVVEVWGLVDVVSVVRLAGTVQVPDVIPHGFLNVDDMQVPCV